MTLWDSSFKSHCPVSMAIQLASLKPGIWVEPRVAGVSNECLPLWKQRTGSVGQESCSVGLVAQLGLHASCCADLSVLEAASC